MAVNDITQYISDFHPAFVFKSEELD